MEKKRKQQPIFTSTTISNENMQEQNNDRQHKNKSAKQKKLSSFILWNIDSNLTVEQQAYDLKFWQNKKLAKQLEVDRERERNRLNEAALRTKEKFMKRCQFLTAFYDKKNGSYQQISQGILDHISETLTAQITGPLSEESQQEFVQQCFD